MSITRKRLIEASTIAGELNKNRDSRVLSDLASSLQKWGQLTSNQHSYATALLGRYEGESLEEIRAKQERTKALWDNKDEEFLDLLDFVCFFYVADNCTRYNLHMSTRRTTASRLQSCLEAHRKGSVPFPSEYVGTLMNSKLWIPLSNIKEETPMYQVGDLVSIRGKGQYFTAWTTKHGGREGRFVREGFHICIITEVVNGTYRCNKPNVRGTSRLYRVKAFSGGQSKEILIEEALIKPMK